MKVLEQGTKLQEAMKVSCRACGSKLQAELSDLREGYSGLDCEHGYYVNCAICMAQIHIDSNSAFVNAKRAKERVAKENSDWR